MLNLAREHGPKATSWNALPRAGRSGYKHAGLEIEVIAGGEPAEDVAGAILQMVSEYSAAHAVPVFRIDAYDESGARLGDVLVRIADDGGADEIETSNMGGGARWALKALDDTHGRHMKTLDVIPQLVEMVGQCLEAMGGAVASAAEAKMAYASNEAEAQAAEHTHEKQMRMLELLAAHMGASSATAKGRSPLADLLATMPDDVRETLREILGPLFGEMAKAVHEADPEIRKAQLAAIIERIEPSMKLEMGAKLPEEWQTQLLAAWRAELAS
ncbi:MAG TPA: hypothetical protein VM487_01165 [Phycisphaerae bacterium]|nr:hypothetical protein [Phycisphaerae bacterium]